MDKSTQKAKNRGSLSQSTDSGRSSFYNVHSFSLPLFRLGALLPGFTCLKKVTDFTLPFPFWLSELDPTWRNPDLAQVFNLHLHPWQNVEAQMACIADCEAANKRKPTSDLFWCSGCSGPLYPLTGHVGNHISGIQASSLIAHRAIARHHFLRSCMGVGTGYEEDSYCKQKVFPYLQKHHYKTQLIHPVPDEGVEEEEIYCRILGASTEKWGSRKTYPQGGEDFAYLVWSKMHCCWDLVDAVKWFVPGADAAEEAAAAAAEAGEKMETMKEKIEALEKDTSPLDRWNDWKNDLEIQVNEDAA